MLARLPWGKRDMLGSVNEMKGHMHLGNRDGFREMDVDFEANGRQF